MAFDLYSDVIIISDLPEEGLMAGEVRMMTVVTVHASLPRTLREAERPSIRVMPEETGAFCVTAIA